MDQSQGGNPFGRLIEFARPHKTGYIVSVVLAVLGVAFGIVPYFATARMTIELLSGNRDLSFYMVWCLISGGCFVLKAILMGISTRASHEATFEVLSEARRKIASKLTRVPMGYILNTPSGQLKNGMVERIEQLEVPLAHVIPEMTSNLLVPIAIIVYAYTRSIHYPVFCYVPVLPYNFRRSGIYWKRYAYERNHGEKFFQESTSSIRISNCPSYDVCSNNRE